MAANLGLHESYVGRRPGGNRNPQPPPPRAETLCRSRGRGSRPAGSRIRAAAIEVERPLHEWMSSGLGGPRDRVPGVAFSPDPSRVAAASTDGGAWVWEA